MITDSLLTFPELLEQFDVLCVLIIVYFICSERTIYS